MSERSKRKRHLLIFGVNEQDQAAPANDRFDSDKQAAEEIVRMVRPSMDLSSVKHVRIGRHSNDRNRPIKLVFKDEREVIDVIKNAKALQGTPYHKKISLSFDRTPRQIDCYKKIKEQLTERINSGETNLKIRYINGIPKIVSEN